MPETSQDTQPGPDGVDRGHLRNYEQLRRSVDDRRIAGVAGGLGRHLNIDATVLRVLFVVLCFFGGAGFVLYAAAWLVVPEEGRTGSATIRVDDRTRNTVLIIVGAVAALLVVGHSWGGFGPPWPLAVLGVAAAAYLVLRDRGSHQPPAPRYADPATGGPADTAATSGTAGVGTTYADPPGPGAPPPAPAWQPPPYQPRPPKRGPRLFGFTVAALMLALGGLGFADALGVHVAATAYPALAVAVVGVMLVVGAFVGRAGGLVLLGIVASMALGITSLAGVSSDGDRLVRTPLSSDAVQPRYFLKAGTVRLDLSKVANPEELAGRRVDVGGRVGELVVVLPPGVASDVHAEISGPGGIDLPDDTGGGIGTELTRTYAPPGTDVGLDRTFVIDAHLSAGHIEIRKAP